MGGREVVREEERRGEEEGGGEGAVGKANRRRGKRLTAEESIKRKLKQGKHSQQD